MLSVQPCHTVRGHVVEPPSFESEGAVAYYQSKEELPEQGVTDNMEVPP